MNDPHPAPYSSSIVFGMLLIIIGSIGLMITERPSSDPAAQQSHIENVSQF